MKKFLFAFYLAINTLTTQSQENIPQKENNLDQFILYSIEGNFKKVIDTVSIKYNEPNKFNFISPNRIYCIKSINKKEEFIFAADTSEILFIAKPNIEASTILNSSLNDSFNESNQLLSNLIKKIDSIYEYQAQAIGKNDLNAYHYYSEIADSVRIKIGHQVQKKIQNRPDFLVNQWLYITHFKYLQDSSITQIFSLLKSNNNYSWFSSSFFDRLQRLENTQAGKRMPDIAIHDTNGRLLNLLDTNRNSSLLIFSASWCLPCKELINFLKTQYLKGIWPVNVDIFIAMIEQDESGINKAKVEITNWPRQWRYFIAKEGSFPLLNSIEISGFPTCFWLNNNGYIKRIIQGYQKPVMEAILKEIVVEKDGSKNKN